jgi:hypothetical protein
LLDLLTKGTKPPRSPTVSHILGHFVKFRSCNPVDPIRLPNAAAARYADGHRLRAFEDRKWRTLAEMRDAGVRHHHSDEKDASTVRLVAGPEGL